MSSRKLGGSLDRYVDYSNFSKVEAKYGVCEGRSVNGSRGDLDSHEPFFDIKGLAVLRGLLCRGGVGLSIELIALTVTIMIIVLRTQP